MHQNDLLRIPSCNQKELEALAKAYNVAPTGPRLIYGVRVQAQNPFTKVEKHLKRSLHTTDLRSALVRAVPMVDNWLAAVKSERAPALRVGADKLATVAAVLEAYALVPLVKANAASRKRNAASLRAVLAAVHGELPADASSGLITRDTAEAFQRVRQVAAMKEPNLLKRDAMLRSANNTLKQAQSVVCRRALDDMHGLKLDTEGCRAFNARALIPVDAPPEPEQLPDVLVAKIRAAAEGLLTPGVVLPVVVSGEGGAALVKQVPGASVWAAFQLMVWTGARPIEVENAQLNWLVQDGPVWRLRLMKTEGWKPKGGGRGVPLPPRVVEQLQALTRREGDTHIVPSRTATERAWACYRALNPWLRGLGVEERAGHVAYRLRAYFLNLVREETLRQMDALAVAAGTAGHADSTTTMSYVGKPSLRVPVSLP